MEQGSPLEYAVKRSITIQAKRTLELLEDLRSEHKSQFKRLRSSVGALDPDAGNTSLDIVDALVDQADYFDEDRWSRLRKRVLDASNEAQRELEEEFSKYKINLG